MVAAPLTPGRPLLVFDGDCAFCTATAGWITRRLPPGAEARPWQHLDLDALGLSRREVSTAAYWIDEGGGVHRGHRSVGRALVACGGIWSLPGWLCLVPPTSWLAAGVYALVARHRHRLPGGSPACRIE